MVRLANNSMQVDASVVDRPAFVQDQDGSLVFVPDIAYEGVDETLIPCDGYVSVVLDMAQGRHLSTHAISHTVRSMAQHPQRPARLAALIADVLTAQPQVKGVLVSVLSRPGRLEHRAGHFPIHAASGGTLRRGRYADAAKALICDHYPNDHLRQAPSHAHTLLAVA